MYLKRYVSTILLLCISGIFFTGCEKEDSSEKAAVEQLTEIVIGGDDYRPFSYIDENGNYAGIDVDLAKEAFGRLGYKPVFQYIDWENKNTLLQNREIDCIWSCFSIDGRENEYQWSIPYMISRQVVAVNVNSDIYKLEDLDGKVVAVQSTTKPESLFLAEGNRPETKIRELYSLEDRELIYTLLGKGYVDAIGAHEASILQYMQDYDVEYRILDECLVETGIGVAFSLDDDRGLNDKLSEVFQEMREDGTMKKIVEKYISDADKYLEVEKLEK